MTVVIEETDNGTKDSLTEELERISRELPDETAKELEAIWTKIWRDAVTICPKDTGALASSIKIIEGGMGVGGGLGVERTPRLPIANWIFDRSIIAGDENIINKKTGKSTAMYAEWVHDGHMMRNGVLWAGVPFLTLALMAHEVELMSAVNKAMQELGLNRRE